MSTVIFFVSAFVSMFHITVGQFCGLQLQDIPNPASDSCTAFFRCYQNRQYSLRCRAGEAFDFTDSRCRSASLVDCPLQLQRFQAPGIPHHLRPAHARAPPRVEVRVIQVGDTTNPNNLMFVDDNGQRVPVTRQNGNMPQGVRSQIRSHPDNPFLKRSIHQSPIPRRNAGDQVEGQRLHHTPQAISNAGNLGPNQQATFSLR